ncbi:MAG: hypothetical protein DRP60_09925 [Spirochaetes bacterium]|nr:MAG: hypothetical protein DRP60_09925 [Spirochaetota bacterium]
MRILYLIRRNNSDRDIFRNNILDFVNRSLLHLADEVVVAVSDILPPGLSVIPFRKDLIALITLESIKPEVIWPEPPEGFTGAFVSEVAFPVIHKQDWKLGEKSPGAGLLTIFRQRKGLTESEFLQRWYEGHTPLTLEVHPNVGYVRNRVISDYPGAGSCTETWDGIVEEQYNPPKDLLSPIRFFGGGISGMLPTMVRVYRDVKGFIDYPSIHTWLTSEYRMK